MAGQPGQDNGDRAAGTKKRGQKGQNMSARTCQLGQGFWDRAAGTGQSQNDIKEQDNQDKITVAGQPWRERDLGTART